MDQSCSWTMIYFDMEYEDREHWGKLIVSAAERVPRGMFCFCVREGERLTNIVTGSYTDLGDSFFANGKARSYVFHGRDVYFIFNPEDVTDEDIKKLIFPPGMKFS